ncbi:MAG TPA: glycoside hydrolase family 3 protein, partial [Microlunatus sp.]|nr:glycoside hydrolase family 3 protein [Microlunatus sp.]
LAARLAETGRPLVVVAARDPYDLRVLPERAAVITGYSGIEVTLGAVARVLLGRQPAPGRLPVEITR